MYGTTNELCFSANQPLSDIHREVKAERWIFLERDNK